ncbi:pentatricopeptide repeat-containing protein At3g29230-like [Wolffia australiana]
MAEKLLRNCSLVAENKLIRSFAERKSWGEALAAYGRLREKGLSPNGFTFTFLVRAMASRWREGRAVHGQVVRHGCGSSVFVMNALLSFYSKSAPDAAPATRLFDEMPDRDVVTWNCMLHAHVLRGEVAAAGKLFEEMPERSVVTWNCMLTGLCRAGDVAAAVELFAGMEVKDVVTWTAMVAGFAGAGEMAAATAVFRRMPGKNTVSWNAVISGYCANGNYGEALRMWREMLDDGGCRTDEVTLVAAATACGGLGALGHGGCVLSFAKKSGLGGATELGNAVLTMFAKCGDVAGAERVFMEMERRCVISWTAMIWGLGVHGRSRAALKVYGDMRRRGVEPDDVTFLALLSACAHGGEVEEGQRLFQEMVAEFRVDPRMEHYGCMVDLLARAGRTEEAVRFVESMPIDPNQAVWAALLSPCRWNGDAGAVDLLGRKMAAVEPLTAGCRVLISHNSAAAGQWDHVASIRGAMWHDGLEKTPGCSSIQVGFQVHEFMAKDLRHEKRSEIYEVLHGLAKILHIEAQHPA